jgi:type VI secretion system secreted protein Hcp
MTFDAFLKIAEIPGESTDDKHKNEIDVLSYSWGITRPKGDRGRAKVSDFSIMKFTDKASPILFDAACEGRTLPEAIFTARKAGGTQQEFLKYVFTDVVISSVQPGGSTGGESSIPTESVSLNFTKVEITYTPQAPTGQPLPPVTSSCSPSRDLNDLND